jgi:hypothetical protein
MRGAPARALQELAGHQDLGTTQRYMHLSPAALDAAIRLLDGAESRGGIVEGAGHEGLNAGPLDKERLRPQARAGGKAPRCGGPERAASVGSEAGPARAQARMVEAPGVAIS